MALVENSRKRIGEKQLGVLFDGARCAAAASGAV